MRLNQQLVSKSLILVVLLAGTAAFAADIGGKWAATIETVVGPMNYTFVLKIEGNKVTGTTFYNGDTVAIENGEVEADKFTFLESRNLDPLGPIHIEYACTLKSAVEMACSRDVGGIAQEEFVMKRQQQ